MKPYSVWAASLTVLLSLEAAEGGVFGWLGKNEASVDPAASIPDVGSIAAESEEAPPPRSLQAAEGATFAPLECNAGGWDACVPWTSQFGNATTLEEETTIPCGSCVTMAEFSDGETLELLGGLDVIGKLLIPDGARVTIRTPFVFVQGSLSATSTKAVDGTPDVSVELFGTSDRYFVPAGENKELCPSGGCNVGKKATVVAGGTLDVTGLPEGCPTWVRATSTREGDLPVPAEGWDATPELPTVDGRNCTSTVLSEDFSSGLNGWTGNWGASYERSDEGHMSVGRRMTEWQGPIAEIGAEAKACMVPNEAYEFSARVRLRPDDPDATSLCSSEGSHCPAAKWSHMTDSDEILFSTVAEAHGSGAAEDGTWFELKGTFSLTRAELSSSDLFAALSIGGVEPGVSMDVDDVSIALAAHEETTAETACLDLVRTNGDAGSGSTFPFRSFMPDTEATVRYEGSNPYFHLGGRTEQFSTLAIDGLPSCVVAGTVYRFSSRIRVDSEEEVLTRVMIKFTPEDGPTFMKFVKLCPVASREKGWVTCAANVPFEAEHVGHSKMEVLFITLDNTDDVDYDDLSFSFVSASTGETGLTLPKEVAGCWAPGASVAIASSYIDYHGEQAGTISSVDPEGVVTLAEDVEPPSSVSSVPDYAEEIALTSRNVEFRAADDDEDDPLHGGYLTVLRTNAVQKVEGAAFRRFGQMGKAGRFPLFFSGGGDLSGSSVSKNAVVESFQRCVVLEDADNLSVTDNVAYDSSGHCFDSGKGSGNVFDGNLGMKIKRVTKLISTAETDHSPSVFRIGNPGNSFSNNVAAGCQDSGFLFDLSIDGIHGDLVSADLALFENNVAHSLSGEGLKTTELGYAPATAQTFSNFKAYRNRGTGIYLRNSKNLAFRTGIVADCKTGIHLDKVDSTTIADYSVVGYSDEYLLVAELRELPRHCWGPSPPIYGIKIATQPLDKSTDAGLSLDNVVFENWKDDIGCPGSAALVLDDLVASSSFDAKVNVTRCSSSLDAPAGNLASFCDALEAGVDQARFEDDGGLNPDGDGAGSIVTDDPAVTSMFDECRDFGACAKYCRGGGCVRTVTVSTDPQGSEGLVLAIDGGRSVEGRFVSTSPEADTLWTQRREYTLALGSGSFDASFKDAKNNSVWPEFATVSYGDEPDCDGFFDEFALVVPPADEETCSDLVHNGNFSSFAESDEDLASSRWHHTGGGMAAVRTPGGWALSTSGRTDPNHGLAHFLDTRCLEDGALYSVRAKVKLVPPGGYTGATECDPDQIAPGGMRCPRANLVVEKDGEASYLFAVADTLGPFAPGEWNDLVGTFDVSPETAAADAVMLYVDGVREGVEIQIADVVVQRSDAGCDEIVKNGDFASGTSADWVGVGNSGVVVKENSVYGTAGYSLSTVTRAAPHLGPQQVLTKSCIHPGLTYEVQADFRLELYDGSFKPCDPFYYYPSSDWSCPRLTMKTILLNGTEQIAVYEDIGWAVGPFQNDAWNPIYGTFKATPSMPTAVRVELSLINARAGVNEVLDRVSIRPVENAPNGCEDLVLNGDAEAGDARYWFVKGGNADLYGTVSLVSPGAGDSDYAFRHQGRGQIFNGLWQYIDRGCTKEFSKWVVSADFKLYDVDGNDLSCDKNAKSGSTVCPQFMVQSVMKTGGTPYSTPLYFNNDDAPFVLGEWNSVSYLFTMNTEHLSMDLTYFYVNNVGVGVVYEIDNVRIVPQVDLVTE